ADDVMRGAFRDFSGNVYTLPGVNVQVESGRTFAHRTQDRFDLVLISYADSQSSNTQGASVLSENHLYTQEGWQSYWNTLTDDGVASAAMSAFWGNHMLPRMLNTMRAALEAEGVAEPQKHLLAVITPQLNRPGRGIYVAMTRRPVSDAVTAQARAACDELGFTLAWPPSTTTNPYTAELAKLFAPATREAFVGAHPYDLTPLVDDRPYLCYGIRPATFFNLLLNPLSRDDTYPVQLRTLHLLMDLFLAAFLCVFVLMLSPLVLFKRAELAGTRGGRPYFLTIFFLLGAGYVMIELALLQEFFLLLGDPTLTFAVTLAAMLGFTGAGSYLSAHIRDHRLRRAIGLIALLVLVLQAVAVQLLPGAVHALLSLPLLVRFVVVFAVLGVLATPMGMIFPSTIRLLAVRRIDMTCWAWGMNGVGSVLGSVGTTIVSMNYGIHSVFWLGLACYGLVALTSFLLPPNVTASP
ncbi:MAG: hypothetical protein HYV26_10300, partial [Candidatus Hydrogenedentes bacterium]|nr:hypothetical protein [Candidatus Hydrogenedentota bacterium]